MSDPAIHPAAETRRETWLQENRSYLDTALEGLRLLLERRVVWLRRVWNDDPLSEHRHEVISDARADWLLTRNAADAEAAFYREDPHARELSLRAQAAREEASKRRQALTEAGTPPALEVLARTFGLSPFAEEVLLLCLGPKLDPAFGQLYGYVQDRMTLAHATPHLVASLLVGNPSERHLAHETLLPEGQLRRFQLIRLEPAAGESETGPLSALHLDERIVDYLLGHNILDARAADLLRPLPPSLMPDCHAEAVHSLARELRGDRRPLVNLVGPPGSGRRSVAEALCEELGLSVLNLKIQRLPADSAERLKLLRLLGREAPLLGFALYIDADDAAGSAAPAAEALSDVLDHLDAFVLVASRQNHVADHEMRQLRLGRLDADAQRELWQRAIRKEPEVLDGQIEPLVQQFDFGPVEIAKVAQQVNNAHSPALAVGDGVQAQTAVERVWTACRELAGVELGDLAQRIEPLNGWEDIVLPAPLLDQLHAIAAQVGQRARVYENWGFGRKMSRGRGIGALFAGPSGTGKTLAAEILARHLKLDLYRIDLSGVVSKYIGETEKNLRRVFDAAEQSGAILFFDEADALFGRRSEVKDSHDRYANIEVSYLLQRMEDYRGLAILATNMKSHLDQAFLRRLRFVVDFPFPDSAQRRLIWQLAFSPDAPLDGVDYAALARLEVPGGNIRNIALNAAFLAADEGMPIGMQHLARSARTEYAKIDKQAAAGELERLLGKAVP